MLAKRWEGEFENSDKKEFLAVERMWEDYFQRKQKSRAWNNFRPQRDHHVHIIIEFAISWVKLRVSIFFPRVRVWEQTAGHQKITVNNICWEIILLISFRISKKTLFMKLSQKLLSKLEGEKSVLFSHFFFLFLRKNKTCRNVIRIRFSRLIWIIKFQIYLTFHGQKIKEKGEKKCV